MAKITEKIERWRAERPGTPWFSLEFFTTCSDDGAARLYEQLDRLASFEPLWIDVTWGPDGAVADTTFEMCINALKYHGLDVMMHLTCTNTEKSKLHEILVKCKENDIVNILALRGEAPEQTDGDQQQEGGGFTYAADLVRYIRENFGDDFCIAVAGYPEGHREAESRDKDIEHLREKVDAGADLIMAQFTFDNAEFFEYADKVQKAGIAVPLVAGVMPIASYDSFTLAAAFHETKVPASVSERLEAVKEDEQKVVDFGAELGVRMCRELQDRGVAGIHFYTLNLEEPTARILRELDFAGAGARAPRPPLPWRRSAEPARSKREVVRPVYWAQRPRSYLMRTAAWTHSPPAEAGACEGALFAEGFREPELLDMQGLSGERHQVEGRRLWGEKVASLEDVAAVFVGYLRGHIQRLPWCQELPRGLGPAVLSDLVALSRRGLLVVHWQPRANGVPSTDSTFGWGPPRGLVYQKAYLEFFASRETLDKLVEGLAKEKLISYIAANGAGDVKTNVDPKGVNAVAWGVFPGMQVQQPTVADCTSFLAWKDEAFGLWSEWIESHDKASPSREFLTSIQASWYLVSVLDDNFATGDLIDTMFRASGG